MGFIMLKLCFGVCQMLINEKEKEAVNVNFFVIKVAKCKYVNFHTKFLITFTELIAKKWQKK
jgi:hypothetical protein